MFSARMEGTLNNRLPGVRTRVCECSGGGAVKLLVVDSDHDMAEMLTGWLKTRGYEVHSAFNGEHAKTLWVQCRPDLVILDTALKDVDGLALCRDMRCMHDALVLVVTGESDVRTEVRCLESGADDFLPKPFMPGQLLAHIGALSRRVRTTLERRPSFVTIVGPIRVDALRHEVSVYGKSARLTPTESKVLHMLAANANDVCTLDQIVAHVWGYGDAGDTYLIKAHIRHLREKIEADPGNPRFIKTVAGVGYTLVRQPDQPDPTAKRIARRHALALPSSDLYESDEDAGDAQATLVALKDVPLAVN